MWFCKKPQEKPRKKLSAQKKMKMQKKSVKLHSRHVNLVN